MSLVAATKKKRDFDPKKFLATIGEGRRIVPVAKKQTIYAQGAACDAVFYIQGGKVRLTVVSESGKEATVGPKTDAKSILDQPCLPAHWIVVDLW